MNTTVKGEVLNHILYLPMTLGVITWLLCWLSDDKSWGCIDIFLSQLPSFWNSEIRNKKSVLTKFYKYVQTYIHWTYVYTYKRTYLRVTVFDNIKFLKLLISQKFVSQIYIATYVCTYLKHL